MPLSFRFYDPIFHIILEKMTAESSDYFKLKNTLKKEIYSIVDRKFQYLEKMGFRETYNKDY